VLRAQAKFDRFGNLFVTYLSATGVKTVVAWSGDDGAHFAGFAIIDNGTDQPSVATGPGGLFAAGSVWVSYFKGGNSGIMASGATVTGRIGQGGTIGTFSKPQLAPGSVKPGGSFGDVAVGPHGEVIVTYQSPVAAKSSGPSTIYVNRDLDGLGSGGFGPAIAATTTLVQGYTPIPAQPDRQIDAEANLAWDLHSGRIYLVYTDRPSLTSADTNIYVRYSVDSGATWKAPVLVNDDAGGASQFNPAIAVDQSTGNVAVTWYDCRNSPGNNTAQIYGTISTTGGASWLSNVQIGAGLSNGVGAGTFNFGDFDTMDFANGVFYRAWADNSTSSNQDPFTARVSVVNS